MKKNKIDRWAVYNICGHEVTVSKMRACDNEWFCSYVTIKGSRVLNDAHLNYPTYRDGDKFGYDTVHAYNDKQTQVEKLSDAVEQIQHGIEQALKVLDLNQHRQ